MTRKHLMNHGRRLIGEHVCCVWRDKISDACIGEVVSAATRTATKQEITILCDMSDLSPLPGNTSPASHRKWKGRTITQQNESPQHRLITEMTAQLTAPAPPAAEVLK